MPNTPKRLRKRYARWWSGDRVKAIEAARFEWDRRAQEIAGERVWKLPAMPWLGDQPERTIIHADALLEVEALLGPRP